MVWMSHITSACITVSDLRNHVSIFHRAPSGATATQCLPSAQLHHEGICLHISPCEGHVPIWRKHQVTKMYQRVQQRITVDDAELSKLGIPILKINSKCV